MPRPRKRRCVRAVPPALFYKPQGIPLGQLRGATLALEGFEALRLVDAKGLSQEEAARLMEVSRPTLCRILGEARTVVAKALTNGWAIRIEDAAATQTQDSQDGNPTAPGRTGCQGTGQGRGCGERRGGGHGGGTGGCRNGPAGSGGRGAAQRGNHGAGGNPLGGGSLQKTGIENERQEIFKEKG